MSWRRRTEHDSPADGDTLAVAVVTWPAGGWLYPRWKIAIVDVRNDHEGIDLLDTDSLLDVDWDDVVYFRPAAELLEGLPGANAMEQASRKMKMEQTPTADVNPTLPTARTIEECHNLVIPFMEGRGFVFESGRHNSRSDNLEGGGSGWYATFFRDNHPTCQFCDNPLLSWGSAEHGADFVEVVNLAARHALDTYK
jgi:hypothetical protein